jgi:hypothetical protein
MNCAKIIKVVTYEYCNKLMNIYSIDQKKSMVSKMQKNGGVSHTHFMLFAAMALHTLFIKHLLSIEIGLNIYSLCTIKSQLGISDRHKSH